MLNIIRLRFLRERIGLSQSEVANILNVSRSHYSHYENGDETIRLKHLITLADYYNVSLDYLLEFVDFKKYKNSNKEVDKLIFIERFKNFRKENTLTQQKLAELLNTTKSVISGYETGRYLISTDFLYVICKKYCISADYLLGKVDSPKYLK